MIGNLLLLGDVAQKCSEIADRFHGMKKRIYVTIICLGVPKRVGDMEFVLLVHVNRIKLRYRLQLSLVSILLFPQDDLHLCILLSD